jgi:uroporphyrinogen-III synthase
MRVLVTRPESEARHWVEALSRNGFDAQALPLIEIAPVPDRAPVREAWRQLDRYRAVMFVSGNAVRHFFSDRQGHAWPPHTRAWAPGTGTRDAVLAAGVDPQLIDAPPARAAQFDSETLWQQVAGQVGAGDSVLIVRGADAQGGSGGREWLAEQVAAGGARAQTLAVYLRQPPRWTSEQMAEALRAAGPEAGVWLFSSSQSISHLQVLLPAQRWADARAVATHQRIAQAARRAGFGVVCEARPSVADVVAALESFR